MDSPSTICVSPLSSPFSLLPRAHTYALAATLLLPLPRGWLFRAALAAFTTRTALFAVDAAVLLAALQQQPTTLPLDTLLVLQGLALAAAVACWLLLVARRESAARGLVRTWAAVVGVGAMLAFAAVVRLGRRGGVDGGPAAGDECREARMPRDELFGPVEAVPVLGLLGAKTAWFARRVGVPGLLLAALAVLAAMVPQETAPVRVAGDVEEGDVVKERTGPWAHLKWAVALFGWAVRLLVPAMAIFIVVSTEQFLVNMVPSLPSLEPTASVGQWGVWAATGVVLTATFINASKEHAGLSRPAGKGPDEAEIK